MSTVDALDKSCQVLIRTYKGLRWRPAQPSVAAARVAKNVSRIEAKDGAQT